MVSWSVGLCGQLVNRSYLYGLCGQLVNQSYLYGLCGQLVSWSIRFICVVSGWLAVRCAQLTHWNGV